MVHKPISIVSVTSKPKQQVSKLTALVDQSIEVLSPRNLIKYLDSHIPDVILVADCSEDIYDLLCWLYDSFDPTARPTIILFLPGPPDEEFDVLADSVLPQAKNPMLHYQIQRAFNDKSRRTALEHQVEEIEILKEAIVRNVSHELRTPLLQVKSAVAMIVEDTKDKRLAKYATQATARLEAVVKNITQLAASLRDMQMTPLIIHECVDSALREIRRTWEHQHHISRIHVEIEDHLPPAYGNRQGITTVLEQLIDNALKFSDDVIQVSAHYADDFIVIAVEDHGIGFDMDKLDAIFVEFVQLDDSETRHYGGTGVGLANVRLILDRHHVKIEVESIKNEGSRFWFSLPVANLDDE